MQNKNLYIQICNDFGNVMYSYKTHIKKSALLNRYRKLIVFTQIILSAISSGDLINTISRKFRIITWISSISALLLFILNLVSRKMDISKEIIENHKSSNNLWMIKEKYIDLLVGLKSSKYNFDEIMSKYKNLQKETSNVYKSAPIAGGKAYLLARHELMSDDQYFSIDELNQMLPPNLRIKN